MSGATWKAAFEVPCLTSMLTCLNLGQQAHTPTRAAELRGTFVKAIVQEAATGGRNAFTLAHDGGCVYEEKLSLDGSSSYTVRTYVGKFSVVDDTVVLALNKQTEELNEQGGGHVLEPRTEFLYVPTSQSGEPKERTGEVPREVRIPLAHLFEDDDLPVPACDAPAWLAADQELQLHRDERSARKVAFAKHAAYLEWSCMYWQRWPAGKSRDAKKKNDQSKDQEAPQRERKKKVWQPKVCNHEWRAGGAKDEEQCAFCGKVRFVYF